MDTLNQLPLAISVASFLFFQCLFHRGSHWLSAHLSSGFLKLSSKQRIEWNSRTVSTVHALVVGLFCINILFFDKAIKEDPVWGDATWVKISASITTGYVSSDLLLIIYYWNAIGDRKFILHHIAVLLPCCYVLAYGVLPYFATLRMLAELSTPCVNLRWFFEVLGYPKSSTANIANGMMLAAMFFLVRVAVLPEYYACMYAVYGSDAFYSLSFGTRLTWIVCSIFLDLMNVMWMHRIARGCYKAMCKRQEKLETLSNGKAE